MNKPMVSYAGTETATNTDVPEKASMNTSTEARGGDASMQDSGQLPVSGESKKQVVVDSAVARAVDSIIGKLLGLGIFYV